MVVAPEEKLAETAGAAGLSVSIVAVPGAEMIARLGVSKLHAGMTVSPEQLEANYIRRTDAEIFAIKS
jgi:hypothetical protein